MGGTASSTYTFPMYSRCSTTCEVRLGYEIASATCSLLNPKALAGAPTGGLWGRRTRELLTAMSSLPPGLLAMPSLILETICASMPSTHHLTKVCAASQLLRNVVWQHPKLWKRHFVVHCHCTTRRPSTCLTPAVDPASGSATDPHMEHAPPRCARGLPSQAKQLTNPHHLPRR